MEKITLTKASNIGGKEVTELAPEFTALTGNDLIQAEAEARAMGDNTPFIAASMRYQAAVAARALKCPADDVMALGAKDFTRVIAAVTRFLLA